MPNANSQAYVWPFAIMMAACTSTQTPTTTAPRTSEPVHQVSRLTIGPVQIPLGDLGTIAISNSGAVSFNGEQTPLVVHEDGTMSAPASVRSHRRHTIRDDGTLDEGEEVFENQPGFQAQHR